MWFDRVILCGLMAAYAAMAVFGGAWYWLIATAGWGAFLLHDIRRRGWKDDDES